MYCFQMEVFSFWIHTLVSLHKTSVIILSVEMSFVCLNFGWTKQMIKIIITRPVSFMLITPQYRLSLFVIYHLHHHHCHSFVTVCFNYLLLLLLCFNFFFHSSYCAGLREAPSFLGSGWGEFSFNL